MSLKRLFLAFRLSAPVKQQVLTIQKQLRTSISGLRWTPPENLHVTQTFLGGVPEEDVGFLRQIIQEVVEGHPPIKLQVTGIEVFPSVRHPHVLTLQLEAEDAAAYRRLQKEVGQAVRDRAVKAAPPKPPHLTLARFPQKISPDGLKGLDLTKVSLEVDPWTNETLELIESELTSQGSVYSPRAKLALGGRG